MAKKATLQVTVEGSYLVIKAPLQVPPQPSKSGKNLVVATTRGNVATSTTYDGKPITVGVNAYIRAD